MSNQNNIDKMKKFIEEKKNKSKDSSVLRPDKKVGQSRKGISNKKSGGFFDK